MRSRTVAWFVDFYRSSRRSRHTTWPLGPGRLPPLVPSSCFLLFAAHSMQYILAHGMLARLLRLRRLTMVTMPLDS
ncbi:hypothetical protein BD309DRAFT_646321 [Dichomitus squalens]|nr:hypothetical protein BD309DRAFT_646321 [Dichomitus squalens]